MRFGIFQSAQWPEGTSQQERLNDALEQSVLAEDLGFDSIFMTEHHFSRHGIVSDNIAMLSNLAARTRRIRLGTAVSVLPFHDPVRLAESAAMLDLLSDGRFELGIGKGYQWGEFNGFGLTLDDRAARFDEAIGVILRAWSAEAPFTHSGEYWQYRDVKPEPRPLQRPHPPIWMATMSEDGFERCVEHGWGVMLPQGFSLDLVSQWVANYRAVLERSGKAFDPNKLILARGLYVGEDDDSAWEEGGTPYLEFLENGRRVAQSPGGESAVIASSNADVRASELIGGPDLCVEKLRVIRDLGVGEVIFFINMGGLKHPLVMQSLRRFTSSVLPQLRDSKDLS